MICFFFLYFFFSSRRRHTRCALVTGVQTCALPILPEDKRRGYRPVEIPPRPAEADGETAIEARDLTMRFGDFTAVDHVNLRIQRGEIFGFQIGRASCRERVCQYV